MKTTRRSVVILFSVLVLLIVVAGFVLSSFGHAQNLPVVSKAEASAHLISHRRPIYPAIAKAAHVEGAVVVRAEIALDGKVESAKAISGPPMLRTAAVEAVSTWKYRAFEVNGKKEKVVALVSVPFSLGISNGLQKTDQQVSMQYFPMDRKCQSALQQQDTSDALELCKKEVTIAAQFPKLSQRSLETIDAHEHYGHALLLDHEPRKARKQFDVAIKLAKRFLHKTDTDYANAYVWRATSNEMAGDDQQALQDYSIAEDSLKEGIKDLPKDFPKPKPKDLPVIKTMYTKELISVYRLHAALLRRLGKSAQAAALEAQAQKLQ